MTPQEIIKKFMHSLDIHGFKFKEFTDSEKKQLGIRMINQAVVKNSQFKSAQDLIDSLISDCEYYNNKDKTNGYYNFLKEKCGIDLYNTDTGGITGSDANIIIDNNIIGSGIEKSDEAIAPEYGNYYVDTCNTSQYIDTGNNGWIVQCGLGNDTIISNGEDSICPCSGTNFITISGSNATIDAENSNNNIFIDKNTKSVILFNYNENKDILSGNTDVVILKSNNEKEGNFTTTESEILASSDMKIVGLNNYFNTNGVSIYNGTDEIKINLNDAIDPSNPSPVGAFIKSGNNISFVSTNSEAKQGKIIGHIASIYPKLMKFKFNGLELTVKDRQLIEGSNVTILKEFSSFDDVGSDTSATFQNTYKNKKTVAEFTDTDTNNEYEKYVVAGIYKWWIKEGLKLAKLNYDYDFEDDDTTIATINLHFQKTIGGSSALASVSHSFNLVTGGAVILNLNVNKDFYEVLTDISDINGNALNISGFYLDRTIAHEFTHAIMAAKIKFFACLPTFISEGAAEVAHGIDDKRTNDIIYLARNPSYLRQSVSLTNDYNGQDCYSGGYIFFRYFMKQAALYSQNNMIPDQVHPIVNLIDNLNSNYYVDLDSENPIASTENGNYYVGAAYNNIYTLSDNFEQIIFTDNNKWSILLATSNNTLKSENGNDYVTIEGGHNQLLEFDNGNNNILVNRGDNNTINCKNGNNEVFLNYSETLLNNKVFLGNGNGNVTLCGTKNILNTEDGENSINIFGNLNTINSGIGNDYILQYSNSNGENIYRFDKYNNFGNTTIKNFISNDIILISNNYDVNISSKKNFTVVDNDSEYLGTMQNIVINILEKNTGNTIGTIDIMTLLNNSFNEEKNIQRFDSYEEEIEQEHEQELLHINFNTYEEEIEQEHEQELLHINFNTYKKEIEQDHEQELLYIDFKADSNYIEERPGFTPKEIIKKLMNLLDKHGFDDEGILTENNEDAYLKRTLNYIIAKNSQFTSIQEVIDAIIDDCKKYNENDQENGYETFLKEKCDIDLNNMDTGSITGLDSKNNIEKTELNIVPEYGNYYEIVSDNPQIIKTGKNGWMINCKYGNDTIISNGEDSICTGSYGDNYITLSGSNSIIDINVLDENKGSVNIFIDDKVESVKIFNYKKETTKISGNLNSIIFIDEKEGVFTKIEDAIETSDPDMKIIELDNYFNIDGIEVYENFNESITVELDDALDKINPKPVGAFIKYEDNIKFISSNKEAQQGKLIGHIASIYPQLMSFKFKGLQVNVHERVLEDDGIFISTIKEFQTFDDVGIDTDFIYEKDDGEIIEDKNNIYERYIVAAIYKWWIKESLNLIEESYDYNFEQKDSSIGTINLRFVTSSVQSSALAYVSNVYYLYLGDTFELTLNITKDYYNDIIESSNINGISELNSLYLDRTIAHELTHAIMAAKIKYFSLLPKFIYEGLAETTHGIDDMRMYRIIELAKSYEKMKIVLIFNDYDIPEDYSYAAGYIFLRYFVKQASIYSKTHLLLSEIKVKTNIIENKDTDLYYFINDLKNENHISEYYKEFIDDKYLVGILSNEKYYLYDHFTQDIILDNNRCDVYIDTPKNTIKSSNSDNTIYINGGCNNYLEFTNGCNVELYGKSNTIIGREGTNNIDFQGIVIPYDNNIYLENGIGNITLSGSKNIIDTKDNENNIILDGAENTIQPGGCSNNSIIEIKQEYYIDGNVYKFDKYDNFGITYINYFLQKDKIVIDPKYDIEISEISNIDAMDKNNEIYKAQYLTIHIKNNGNEIGLINITTDKDVNFNEDENIVHITLRDEFENNYNNINILNINFDVLQKDYVEKLLKIDFDVLKKDYVKELLYINFDVLQKNYVKELLKIDFDVLKKDYVKELLDINFIVLENKPKEISVNLINNTKRKIIYVNSMNIKYNINRNILCYIKLINNTKRINQSNAKITEFFTKRYIYIKSIYNYDFKRNILCYIKLINNTKRINQSNAKITEFFTKRYTYMKSIYNYDLKLFINKTYKNKYNIKKLNLININNNNDILYKIISTYKFNYNILRNIILKNYIISFDSYVNNYIYNKNNNLIKRNIEYTLILNSYIKRSIKNDSLGYNEYHIDKNTTKNTKLIVNTKIFNAISVKLILKIDRYVRSYKKPICAFIINQNYRLIDNNKMPYSFLLDSVKNKINKQ